jgi:hypothetical protein
MMGCLQRARVSVSGWRQADLTLKHKPFGDKIFRLSQAATLLVGKDQSTFEQLLFLDESSAAKRPSHLGAV